MRHQLLPVLAHIFLPLFAPARSDKLELTRQLATSIPGARQEIIAGAAHMVTMEQPQEFNRIVLNFLREQ